MCVQRALEELEKKYNYFFEVNEINLNERSKTYLGGYFWVDETALSLGENIMNKNRHLCEKPIIEKIPILEGIGVLARCPKCKKTIDLQQHKCNCGCSIRWDNR